MKLLDKDFLLENEMDEDPFPRLRRKDADYDYHCHLSPQAIYEIKTIPTLAASG